MVTAFVLSSLFLVTYLLHHAQVGSVPFRHGGWIRGVYFAVLVPHVALAAVIVPLSANVRGTRSAQRIRVGRRQRKRTCWDCEREWKRMVVPLEPGGQAKRGSSCGPGGSR